MRSAFVALVLTFVAAHAVAAQAVAPLPSPALNTGSWIMIEIWPEVQSITLSAYFLDFSYGKNQNLCEATKRVFDREQVGRERETGRKHTSYRLCLPVSKARAEGYIRPA